MSQAESPAEGAPNKGSESKGDNMGSVASLRSRKGDNIGGSVTSLRSKQRDTVSGSTASLRSESKKTATGSQASVRVPNDDLERSEVARAAAQVDEAQGQLSQIRAEKERMHEQPELMSNAACLIRRTTVFREV